MPTFARTSIFANINVALEQFRLDHLSHTILLFVQPSPGVTTIYHTQPPSQVSSYYDLTSSHHQHCPPSHHGPPCRREVQGIVCTTAGGGLPGAIRDLQHLGLLSRYWSKTPSKAPRRRLSMCPRGQNTVPEPPKTMRAVFRARLESSSPPPQRLQGETPPPATAATPLAIPSTPTAR